MSAHSSRARATLALTIALIAIAALIAACAPVPAPTPTTTTKPPATTTTVAPPATTAPTTTAPAGPRTWGSWDTDLEGWSATGGTAVQSTAKKRNGAGSLYVTASRNGSAASTLAQSAAQDESIVANGTTLEAWVKLDTAGAGTHAARLSVRSSGGSTAYGPSTTLVADTWTRVAWSPNNTVLSTKSRVGISLDTSGVSGNVAWYVDTYTQGGDTTPITTTTAAPPATTVPPTTTTPPAVTQRFPGDPNTAVTGKSYWGAAVGSNTDPASKHETSTKSLSLRRTYHQWSHIGSDAIVNTARGDLAKNRLPVVSVKPPVVNGDQNWLAVSNGSFDADVDELLRDLDTLNGPVWLIIHHEPENDTNSSTRRSADWRGMQTRFHNRAAALGVDNVAFVAHLMDWTFDSRSGRNPSDWWVPGVLDVLLISNYCQTDCFAAGGNILESKAWSDAVAWAKARNIPYGTGEWQVKDQDDRDPTGSEIIRARWEETFKPGNDFVAHGYFDTDLSRPNPDDPNLGYLRDSNLATFRDITINDPRVQRVNDLP